MLHTARRALHTVQRETAAPTGKLTVNERLLRDLIRSRVKLNQIELRVFRRDVLPILRTMEAEIVDVLASGKGGVTRQSQLTALLQEIRAVITNATAEIPPALEQGVKDAATREVRHVRGALIDAVPEFKAILGTGLPEAMFAQITQRTVKEVLQPFAKNLGTKALARIKDQLSLSVAAGEDMREAAVRVQSVAKITRSHALNIARTGIQTAANLAHKEYRATPEVRKLTKGEQWVATLDTRTCVRCAALDGKWWGEGEGAEGPRSAMPSIPLHNQCRCTSVDVLRSPAEIGLPGLKWSPGTRASMDGQVAEAVTFPEWLKGQPVNIQKSVLGASRWELWKAGKLDFEDFVHAGRMRTIDELGEFI